MGKIKPTNEYFISKAIKIHGNKFDYSLVKYKGSHFKVNIKCSNGHTFDQKPMDHWRGIGCRYCANKNHGKHIKYTEEQILEKLLKLYPNYKFELKDFKNTNSEIKCICPIHGEIIKKIFVFIRGYGCEECNGTKKGKLTNNYFIKKSIGIHGNYYDYSLIEIKGAQNKVKIICPKHGVFEQTPNSHMKGQGCPVCRFSKGELKILKYLKENNINYIHQKQFNNCKDKRNLRFDFYLPNNNLCIEYNGEYHYHSYKRVKGEEGLKLRQKKDEIKRIFCKKNNIKLLEIPYWEYNNIKSILIEAIEI